MTLELTRGQVDAGVDSYFLVILVMFLQFKQSPRFSHYVVFADFYLYNGNGNYFIANKLEGVINGDVNKIKIQKLTGYFEIFMMLL